MTLLQKMVLMATNTHIVQAHNMHGDNGTMKLTMTEQGDTNKP